MNVAIEEAIESAVAIAGIDDFAESFGQSAIADLVSHCVGKDAGLEVRVEAPVPGCKAARNIGDREDFRHAAQASPLERQSAGNASQEPVANSGRHPVEGGGKLIERVFGITAELFVGSLPAQH